MDTLTKLAKKHETDKYGDHTYTPIYHRYFWEMRKHRIHLFEIGVGGFEDPQSGGQSLRMWKDYFPNGKITSMDIYDKTLLQEDRIKIYQGDQGDEKILNEIIRNEGTPQIIIDDGSHLNKHQIKSFEILFPLLANNGIYVIEDTQTSYWPQYGGGNENSAMNYFKKLCDGLNHAETRDGGYRPSYLDLNIISIHFYHNLIFVFKGENTEESNIPIYAR